MRAVQAAQTLTPTLSRREREKRAASIGPACSCSPPPCSSSSGSSSSPPPGRSRARSRARTAGPLDNFARASSVYWPDIWFTTWIVSAAVLITAVLAIAIGGYLTLGGSRVAVQALAWLYRWPLFVPMVCAAQMMRSFLARNGMLNNTLVAAGAITPAQAVSLLDWRGILITFVWKQLPFVTLMTAGAMAALDRSLIEAARDLGASRLRVLFEIIAPARARPAPGRLRADLRDADVGPVRAGHADRGHARP